MRKEVATQACAVIPPTAPAEESFQAKVVPGRRTNELLPVDIACIGLGVNVVHPCAVGVITVGADLYQRDFAITPLSMRDLATW